MTGLLITTICALIALAVALLAENASTIRAWVARDPFDLDEADARARGRCPRRDCTVNHGWQR